MTRAFCVFIPALILWNMFLAREYVPTESLAHGVQAKAVESPSRENSVETGSEWRKLELMSPDVYIKSVKLETYSEPEWKKERIRSVAQITVATSTCTTDKAVLNSVKYCFQNMNCLRRAIQQGARGGQSDAYLVGALTISTNNGQITLGIGNAGFSIDGGLPQTDTEFYSPAGAELVNLMYCKSVGRLLRDEINEGLSGVRFIKERQRAFRRMEYTEALDMNTGTAAEGDSQ